MSNPSLYRIFAYHNGRDKTPEIVGRTGCFTNAEKTAKDFAAEGVLAVVVNTETNNRIEYKPEAATAAA